MNIFSFAYAIIFALAAFIAGLDGSLVSDRALIACACIGIGFLLCKEDR